MVYAFSADNQMYQYFITVVPTRLVTHKISADMHQFSVTERVSKAIKPCASSLGNPRGVMPPTAGTSR